MLLLILFSCLVASQLQAETLPGEACHQKHCLLQLPWVLMTSHLKLPAPSLPRMPPVLSCKRVQHAESDRLPSIAMLPFHDLSSSLSGGYQSRQQWGSSTHAQWLQTNCQLPKATCVDKQGTQQ